MFRKLEALSAAALMILSISLAGCCGGGALCPHAGGGCAAQQALAPVSVDSCSSCAQQTYSQGYSTPAYSQPTYSQSTYAQPAYSQPAYSGGSVVNGSFSPTPAVQGLGSGTTSSVFSGAAPSLGSGTSAPVFSGGSGSR